MNLHVVPTNDIYPHNTDDAGQCDCQPEVEFLEGGDTMTKHNAWDGREIFEELDGKP